VKKYGETGTCGIKSEEKGGRLWWAGMWVKRKKGSAMHFGSSDGTYTYESIQMTGLRSLN
jgi:hypothetical protein